MTLAMFTACVDSNSINVKKEKEMREEATLDVSKMPFQSYDKYIDIKHFILGEYIKHSQVGVYTMNSKEGKNGLAYLKDGTKIKYNKHPDHIYESITKKNSFIEFQKVYYPDTKILKVSAEVLPGLFIGKKLTYAQSGELTKVTDYDTEYRKKGLDYKKLLEGAAKQGFIDLKEGKVLKGNSFKVFIRERKKEDRLWSREEKEEFAKETGLSYSTIDNFKKDKYYWRLDISYRDRTEMYNFTRDGVFVNHVMTSRKMRF